ncbi:MAG: peptide ABC transporter substrate-binding protein [Firmicutes bacterium]|nr:peptide ABC transporter substrate-binding protein [Bacillota bacterium]
MYMSDWGSAYFDPYDLAAPKLITGGRGNRSFFSNKTFDALMTQAATSNNTQLRRADYFKAQQILYSQVPWVFGYYLDNVQVASSRLKGWQPYEDGMEPMARVTPNGSSTVTVALPTNAILTLDPTASYSDRSTEEVIQNVFDSLVTLSPGRTILPQLATRWAVSQGGLTYTFTLRRNVTFQNGQPFTSQDVVFTADRLLGLGAFQGHPSTRAALIDPPGDALTVGAEGPYTVVFHFQKPFPLFLYGLVHMEIVPHVYYQKVGAAQFALHPIGTGPFSYQSGSYSGPIVLARNSRYWGGAPKIAKLVFLPEPDPESTMAGLLSGSIDVGTDLPFDQLSQFENNPQFQVKEIPGTRAYFIELNNKLPPFNNRNVRLAFNYAIDWNTILAAIYGNHAHRMATAFLPSGFGFDPHIHPYPYDPAKAVELLHAAGYEAHVP